MFIDVLEEVIENGFNMIYFSSKMSKKSVGLANLMMS
jgi:hypothetical protein